LSAVAAVLSLGGVHSPALAQQATGRENAQSTDWRPGFLEHIRRAREFAEPNTGQQRAPSNVPNLEFDNNDSGVLGSYRPSGAVSASGNPFFQSLGSNGRSCFTCHQPAQGWSITAAGARARFDASEGRDPLFRLVDGARCPTNNVRTLAQRQRAFQLLTEKGVFRIGLPLPAPPALEFKINAIRDPHGCNNDPELGVATPTTGTVSVFRRPLPSANLGVLTSIMWDGREPNLVSQAVDATLGHAQADAAPSAAQVKSIVGFESGIFTAQIFDWDAGDLRDFNASGGPVSLSLQIAKFFVGVNDPTGQNPKGLPFTPKIFSLYKPWLGVGGADEMAEKRRSIARGERIFDSVPINITGVGGINDPVTLPVVAGFCGTCHDTPNVGNHSVPDFLNIGISNAGAFRSPVIDVSGLPIFMIECTAGPLAGQIFEVTDPGRALITGKCADIGRFKTPTLRGLAARAPYFHNGSAATLKDVVDFYDKRFSIGFTAREKQDLVNFLNTL
jgi:cytochrome c peroxidase